MAEHRSARFYYILCICTSIALSAAFSAPMTASTRRSMQSNGKSAANRPASKPQAPAKPHHAFACPAIRGSDDLMLTANMPVAIAFYSDHCSACEDVVAPFNAFAKQHKGSVACFSANTDLASNQELVQLLKITGVPSVVVLHKHMGAGMVGEFLAHATGMAAPQRAVVEDYQEEESFDEDEIPLARKNTDIPLSITPEDIATVTIEEDTITPDLLPTDSKKPQVASRTKSR